MANIRRVVAVLVAVCVAVANSNGVPGAGITKFDAATLHTDGEHGKTAQLRMNVTAKIWDVVNRYHDPFAEQDVEAAFRSIVADDATIARTRAALRVTFVALPKDQDGRLSPPMARYALHRYFRQTFGWFLRGLQPADVAMAHIRNSTREWIPGYIEGLLAQNSADRSSDGLDLNDLAIFAATIDALVNKETGQRIEDILSVLNVTKTDAIAEDVAECVLRCHVVMLAKEDMTDADKNNTAMNFVRLSQGCGQESAVAKYLHNRQDLMKFSTTAIAHVGAVRDLAAVVKAARVVEKSMHDYTDQQCHGLRNVLRSLERKNEPGYVPLDAYWAQKRYSHWEFIETKEFLQYEGVYDNTTFAAPRIITANYIESRMNCNEVSNMYAACCRSECNDLLQELELALEKPYGSPAAIGAAISRRSLDTMHTSQELPASLLKKLAGIAQTNNGIVALHSHAFELWMHLAFPRQCAKPTSDHTENMMTPSEWMEAEDAISLDGIVDRPDTMGDSVSLCKAGIYALIAIGGYFVRRFGLSSAEASRTTKTVLDLSGVLLLGIGVVGVAKSMQLGRGSVVLAAVCGAQMTAIILRAFMRSKVRAGGDVFAKCV
eukprot:TRINITY_DN20112_c0_g3_i1.p1 TRINITY_DN20112_c0_g3~~TRINITY_DN20112_c0_g3_i1.p1  ORF type:complete len:604 (-),score=100.21 TRINITY_DN20112_c0_g3_i1:117-1928(-)